MKIRVLVTTSAGLILAFKPNGIIYFRFANNNTIRSGDILEGPFDTKGADLSAVKNLTTDQTVSLTYIDTDISLSGACDLLLKHLTPGTIIHVRKRFKKPHPKDDPNNDTLAQILQAIEESDLLDSI